MSVFMKASLAHKLEYYSLRAVVTALRQMDWETACKLGENLGELGYKPFGIRKKVVERQIAAAFPDMKHGEVMELARKSFRHLGRSAIETALMPSLGREGLLKLIEKIDNWDLVRDVVAKGNGVVMTTGHVGNWELAGAYLAARGVPIDVIVRRMANPMFDKYLNRTREAIGMKVVYDQDAVKSTTRALRDGRVVGFVADQGVLGLASTFVPFFGRPAKTPRGAAVFALKFKVPVIFVAAMRQPNGKYRYILEEIPVLETGDREGDVDRIVALYTEQLEKVARRYPEQYFWQHRRWRRQPPDTPRELRDPTVDHA